jgi:hypothetical protein
MRAIPAPGPTPTRGRTRPPGAAGLHRRLHHAVGQRADGQHGERRRDLRDEAAGGEDPPLEVGRHLRLPDRLVRAVEDGDDEGALTNAAAIHHGTDRASPSGRVPSRPCARHAEQDAVDAPLRAAPHAEQQAPDDAARPHRGVHAGERELVAGRAGEHHRCDHHAPEGGDEVDAREQQLQVEQRRPRDDVAEAEAGVAPAGCRARRSPPPTAAAAGSPPAAASRWRREGRRCRSRTPPPRRRRRAGCRPGRARRSSRSTPRAPACRWRGRTAAAGSIVLIAAE